MPRHYYHYYFRDNHYYFPSKIFILKQISCQFSFEQGITLFYCTVKCHLYRVECVLVFAAGVLWLRYHFSIKKKGVNLINMPHKETTLRTVIEVYLSNSITESTLRCILTSKAKRIMQVLLEYCQAKNLLLDIWNKKICKNYYLIRFS